MYLFFGFRHLVIKLPLYNKIRTLKRRLDASELKLKQQIKKQKLAGKADNTRQNKRSTEEEPALPALPTFPMNSPRKATAQVMRDNSLSPSKFPQITKELVAFRTITDVIAKEPKKSKIKILSRKQGMKKTGMASFIANRLGISRKSVFTKRRKSYVRQMKHMQQKASVKEFLEKPENSVPLPGKRDVLARGGQKYTLNDTLTNLFKSYCEEHPGTSMSRSTFAKLRPRNNETHTVVCKAPMFVRKT